MAAKSTKNDLIQITMLTFYLLALFFGGWGMYRQFVSIEEEALRRDRENRNVDKLDELLKKDDTDQILREFQRKQALDDDDLQTSVNDVISNMPSLRPKKINPIRERSLGGGLTEETFNFSFEDTSLRQGLLNFIERLRDERPNIYVEKVNFRLRKDDQWTSDIRLVTYKTDK